MPPQHTDHSRLAITGCAVQLQRSFQLNWSYCFDVVYQLIISSSRITLCKFIIMPRKKLNKRIENLSKARQTLAAQKAEESDSTGSVNSNNSHHVTNGEPSTSEATTSDTTAPLGYANSRTQQKFTYFEDDSLTSASTSPVYRTIVDMTQINRLISQTNCPVCLREKTLTVELNQNYGLAVSMSLFCSHCKEIVSTTPVYTSERDKSAPGSVKPFLVNKAAVLAALQTGLGPYRLNRLCEGMDMPGIHPKTFSKFAARFYSKTPDIAQHMFENASSIIHGAYEQMGHKHDDVGLLDIAVSYDGSWMKRGHTSLVGIGCVIDILTGLVLDCRVMSQHCQTCATTGSTIKDKTPGKYDEWLENHRKSGQCARNFEGSSGMMEVEGAAVLWGRSVEKYNLRYTTFVGDGDSKAYNKVCEIKPYGPETEIAKEECLNHVGKRLGTALRNLVSDCSKRGITLGGKGHGRLTANTIRKLSIYYTRAIRGHETAAEMKKAILASLYHNYSTDEHPQHMYCPPGISSWCFYKKAIANHTYAFGHKKRIHTPLHYDLLHQHLWPVYERLTADNLLSRCEKKATQNQNESFHSSVWSVCGKNQNLTKPRVEMAVISAAAQFNFGPSFTGQMKAIYDIPSGDNAIRIATVRAKKRLNKSLKKEQSAEKRRRKVRSDAIQRARQEEHEEGTAAYAPGMF